MYVAGPGDEDAFVSEASLSRFFFALGHMALQQLVHVEEVASAIRKARLNLEKRTAEARAEGKLPSEPKGTLLRRL